MFLITIFKKLQLLVLILLFIVSGFTIKAQAVKTKNEQSSGLPTPNIPAQSTVSTSKTSGASNTGVKVDLVISAIKPNYDELKKIEIKKDSNELAKSYVESLIAKFNQNKFNIEYEGWVYRYQLVTSAGLFIIVLWIVWVGIKLSWRQFDLAFARSDYEINFIRRKLNQEVLNKLKIDQDIALTKKRLASIQFNKSLIETRIRGFNQTEKSKSIVNHFVRLRNALTKIESEVQNAPIQSPALTSALNDSKNQLDVLSIDAVKNLTQLFKQKPSGIGLYFAQKSLSRKIKLENELKLNIQQLTTKSGFLVNIINDQKELLNKSIEHFRSVQVSAGQTTTSLAIEANKMSVQSSAIGLVILAVSVAFFYMYIAFIYPITITKNTQTVQVAPTNQTISTTK
jgi:hypothetical protein